MPAPTRSRSSAAGASLRKPPQEPNSAEEPRATNAQLAEIRDSLLEIYAVNDPMHQLILAALDPHAWRAQSP
ncbi:MAG: hypothetical protein WA641_03870, partial [Candidatus Acidiferrales bacterium]